MIEIVLATEGVPGQKYDRLSRVEIVQVERLEIPKEKIRKEDKSLWDRRCDRWLGKRDSSGVLLVAQSGRKRLMVSSVMGRHAS